MLKLKKCNRCDSTDVKIRPDVFEETYRVYCPVCGSTTVCYENIDDAIDEWNEMQGVMV